ncbi:MAG: universal stress protein [Hyphomicrobiales bacterium]
MHTIIAATDGSDHGRRAVDMASDLAAKFDANLILMHVAEPRKVTPQESQMVEAEYATELHQYPHLASEEQLGSWDRAGIGMFIRRQTEASEIMLRVIGQGLLNKAKARAAEKGVAHVEAVLRENATPAEAILEAAKEKGADMIVLGSRGLGALSGIVQGSVSQKVAHLADANLVIVK